MMQADVAYNEITTEDCQEGWHLDNLDKALMPFVLFSKQLEP